ncbi:DUF6542 domain-containing protein [Gordonia spumicola]|uniref:DUF6542 domain-containing protein n=1 Tax=Gordonia spumicola TaxID=589161 RepID=UPI001379E99F|nr:DUF6542 domain-containing protein [Gordonia spumicola]
MFPRSFAGSAVPADQQSVIPAVRGLPWWAATLLATGFTAVGAFLSADETPPLGRIFKICLVLGSILAALVVRRRALFTAAVQPPLIAFIVGIVALFSQHTGSTDKKTVIIKVVLPIANAFPWMIVAFIAALLVVLARLAFTGPADKRLFSPLTRRIGGGKPTTKGSSKGSASKAGRPKSAATKAPATKGSARTAPSRERRSSDAATTKTAARTAPSRQAPAPQTKQAQQPKRTAQRQAPKPAAAAATTRIPARQAPQAQAPTATPAQPRRPEPTRSRPPKSQRQTAGQQLRERGHIEDLAAGLDD